MATRLTRPQQVQRNRQLLLDAAREVFGEAGYAGATLEAIAVRAGFSKGVVYSQFASKADLFLALLEQRIAERADENEALVAEQAPVDAIATFLAGAERDAAGDPAWQQVLIEFRAQAARDPELNRRYAALHTRTVDRLARILAGFYERATTTPPAPTRVLAELLLAIGNGLTLERAANADAIPRPEVLAAVVRVLDLPRSST
jgi:AcrR family transcriptional regulator